MGIGAVIGGVAAVGAAAIGAGATKSAANATSAAADRSAAVVEANYNKSAAALQPWQQSGLQANQTINSFLGLSPTQTAQPAQQPNALSQYGGQQGGWASMLGGAFGFDPAQFMPQQQTAMPQQQTATPVNAADGFKQYIANSDYGFQFGQGANKINSGYAGAGTLQSGAAMKGLEDYRQNLQQGYRGEYIGALGNQQSLGLTAAQAQAGVGGNAANSLASIYTNQGQNQAAIAAAQGNNSKALVNSLSTIGAGIFGGKV